MLGAAEVANDPLGEGRKRARELLHKTRPVNNGNPTSAKPLAHARLAPYRRLSVARLLDSSITSHHIYRDATPMIVRLPIVS